jgi:hypothetical protein
MAVKSDMTGLKGDIDEFNDTVVEVVHEFAVDLNCLVVTNHNFTLAGITKAEEEEIRNWQESLAMEDPQVASSVIGYAQNGFDDLRKAANHLALVGIVTRLQHWIRRFVKRQGLTPEKNRRLDGSLESLLVRQLRVLNKTLGDGPVPIADFEHLIDVRDSIIHADARAEWKTDRDRDRKVADEYRNACGDVEVSENQVKGAIEKAIRQVAGYDEKLQSVLQADCLQPWNRANTVK